MGRPKFVTDRRDCDSEFKPAPLTDNAQCVLERRYLIKDEAGKPIETAQDMFRRVAVNVAQAEKNYDPDADLAAISEQFYELMASLEFLPNSPTLMNAGRELQQLSACFVLPVGDSMEEIFETVKQTALIHKSGGGTGFDFSRLRPKNSKVKTTQGVSSGPVSFMTVFDAATETIKQGGARRGANMGILRVDHPDILEFIRCKEENDRLNNFNISVALTDEFMQAIKQEREFSLISPQQKEPVEKLSAAEVFNLIVNMAWKNGEPGVVFIDRMNQGNPTPNIGSIESTNPCGEQPLLPYESCNLGSINLSRMLDNEKQVDFDKLGRVIDLAVQFLDNVIDMNQYPLDIIRERTLGNRKIGLGVMGFADLLIAMDIPYDSARALKLAEKIMKFISDRSRAASQRLAEIRGPFPNFKGSRYDRPGAKPLRNATTTTIAPTGTISLIAGASSGIEPLFAVSYYRMVLDRDRLVEVHPLFIDRARGEGFYSEQLIEKVAEKGSVKSIKAVPQKIRKVFATAHDIAPEWHVKMQAAFQKYTDNAVSKTVNFPESATRENVAHVYMLAYKLGCKGVTIYRHGSRDEQVLNIGKIENMEQHPSESLVPRHREQMTKGVTEKIRIGCGNLYVTVNCDRQGICEVFTNLGRAGGCPSQSEATSRLISLALRAGVDVESIIEQLRGIRCLSTVARKGKEDITVLSCPDAIGKALRRFQSSLETMPHSAFPGEVAEEGPLVQSGGVCPDCGGSLEFDGGCVVCISCGYSKCG